MRVHRRSRLSGLWVACFLLTIAAAGEAREKDLTPVSKDRSDLIGAAMRGLASSASSWRPTAHVGEMKKGLSQNALRRRKTFGTFGNQPWILPPLVPDFGAGGAGDGGGAGVPVGPCQFLVGTIACDDAPVEGSLEDGDGLLGDAFVESWELDIAEAGVITVELSSVAFDTFLFLANDDCELVASNDDCKEGNFDLSCLQVPVGPGRYYLIVSSFDAGETGAYSLQASCAPPLCDACDTSPIVCDGEAISGALAEGDCSDPAGTHLDLYSMTLTEFQRPTLDLTSQAAGPLAFDTFLSVYDSDCVAIVLNDDCDGSLQRSCLSVDLAPGEYFIGVSSFSVGETGSYDLTASCEATADPCFDCEVGSVTCGEIAKGNLGASGCSTSKGQFLDVFSFEQIEDGPVFVNLTAQFDTILSIRNLDCQILAQNDDCLGSTNSCIEGLVLAAGVYFIEVSSFVPGETGPFQLSVDCPDVTLCRECTVGPLSCGVSTTATLAAGDCSLPEAGNLHLYEVQFAEFTTLKLDLRSDAFEPEIFLLDLACRPVEIVVGCADEADRSCAEIRGLFPGTYFVGVRGAISGAVGEYELNAECSAFDPCGDCISGSIECGGSVEGVLSAGDCPLRGGNLYDAYTLRLDQAQDVTIRMESEFDNFLFLIDADCLLVASNDNGVEGTNAVLEAMGVPPGEYFVITTSALASEGSYSVTVECSDVAFCQDCNVGEIGCDAELTGALGPTDCAFGDGSRVDLYSFQNPVDGIVNFNLSSTAIDPYLVLFDSECTFAGENDDCEDGTLNSCLSMFLPAGEYFVAANSFEVGEVGEYRLEIDCESFDPCADCVTDSVGIDSIKKGMLASGDCERAEGVFQDLYEMVIVDAVELSLTLDSDAFDPLLRILDAACLEIARNDDCQAELNSCLVVSLEPGNYFVAASSVFSEESGEYRLGISRTAGSTFRRGDGDGDARINVTDAVRLFYFLFRGADALPCSDGADSNDDGKLDPSDGIHLLSFLFLRGERPAAPGPVECGPDPTDDDLICEGPCV